MNNELISFLIKAKKSTYAADKKTESSSRPHSYDLAYSEGGLDYLDSYYGTHLFTGQEMIWKKQEPVWAMNYSGRVLSHNFKSSFLKNALKYPTEALPYRGKSFYQEAEYAYILQTSGDFTWFKGREIIFYKDELVYELELHGGIILDKHFD